MYRCLDCKEIFDEPDARTWEEVSEYWGRPVGEKFTEYTCPSCGSDDIEEMNECSICGGPAEDDFCPECHKYLEARLDEIERELKTDYLTLQELIAEHFGW